MGFSNLISWFIIITDCRDAERARRHRHPDLGAGGRGAAPDRRRVHLCRIRRRHHRDRPARGSGTGRLGRLCLGEALGWPTGLSRLPRDAKAFYGTIAVATLIGVFINFIDLDPIKALFWSAVIKRRRRGAADGRDHDHGQAEAGHGSVRPAAAAVGDGLAVDRGHGGGRSRHVRDLVRALGGVRAPIVLSVGGISQR